MHWLPCTISHTGPANVGAYFMPKLTGEAFPVRQNYATVHDTKDQRLHRLLFTEDTVCFVTLQDIKLMAMPSRKLT